MSTDLPTLLFLPGLFDDRHMWVHQVEHLGDVCAPLALDVLQPSSVSQAAELVLEQAPDRFALAGFSMGGYVAFEVVRRAPERIARLALISTSAHADTGARTQDREAQIARCEAGGYEALVDEVYPLVVHPCRAEDHDLKDALRIMAMRVGPEAFVRQQRTIMSRPDSRGGLAGISCPTIIMCGNEDMLTPLALSEEMAREIPGAVLALVEQCGHYAPMEQPRAVTDLLRQWLAYP